MDEITREFLVESGENLDRMDRDFVALEKNPADRPTLSSIFRALHTIKGTCGFLGFPKLEALTHTGEDLLARLCDGELVLSPPITSALLRMVDTVRLMLADIEAKGSEDDHEFDTLIDLLTSLSQPAGLPSPPPPAPAQVAPPTPGTGQAEVPAPTPPSPPGVHPKPAPTPSPTELAEPRLPTVAESSVRVDVRLLDKLVNLVGELVLARNQVLQSLGKPASDTFLGACQRLSLITSELQEGVMKTRMQPIASLWDKLPRQVRDLANACGKEVRLELEGADTELDRSLLEAIKDPLTHIVRNAIDHGIEAPAVRLARNKPAAGCLTLRASHEGGQVNIEVQDDGQGIDTAKVRQQAIRHALFTADQAARLSERELLQLIFLPSFSTAEKVTNVSGRGVGMDVVKTNIERIGGAVEVQTRPGVGTSLKIKIPLTLAIIPALIVASGGDDYAIPQANLLEIVRLGAEGTAPRIETILGAPVYRLRGNLLPLVDLNRVLHASAATPPRVTPPARTIVVLQADHHQFGLLVDQVRDTQEIVVKSLGKHLKDLAVFSGATIMGDGRVALILDIAGLAQTAHTLEAAAGETAPAPSAGPTAVADPSQRLLLVTLGGEHRFAIPLAVVGRLEKIPRHLLERAGTDLAVQYRGQILPLIYLTRLLPFAPGPVAESLDPLPVVTAIQGGRSVGLVVGRIVDIVEDCVTIQRESRRPGVLGTAVIQGRMTEVLDLPALLADGENSPEPFATALAQ